MGDLNSVDVAQWTHRGVLAREGCLSHDVRLEYGRPLPPGPVMEGIYIDDHLVVAVVDESEVADPDAAGDSDLLLRVHRAYEAAGLPKADGKSFTREADFVAWGTECQGKVGLVSAPRERRRQLMLLSALLLAQPVITKRLLRAGVGGFVHPFMHRKCCMCSLSSVYTFISNCPEKKPVCRYPTRYGTSCWGLCSCSPLLLRT